MLRAAKMFLKEKGIDPKYIALGWTEEGKGQRYLLIDLLTEFNKNYENTTKRKPRKKSKGID